MLFFLCFTSPSLAGFYVSIIFTGGVLWISSDRDDRMGAKIKTPKNSLDQNLASKKSHAKFPSHKNFQKVLNNIPSGYSYGILTKLIGSEE